MQVDPDWDDVLRTESGYTEIYTARVDITVTRDQ